ncbi:MAG: Uma2 family endonuclease [Methylococcales bacterium]|jgi:Uma2 family endonuclease|nr:Uma2 family endonuclease [Methylococcales bacterium]MBT7408062.1 Uma2 family endonuclease [Methylococcales bacterium]
MGAKKFQTIDDLEEKRAKDERLELINGEIICRPMARAEHGDIQLEIGGELKSLKRKEDPGGWWIMTEVDVFYNEHQRPVHDIAGVEKRTCP